MKNVEHAIVEGHCFLALGFRYRLVFTSLKIRHQLTISRLTGAYIHNTCLPIFQEELKREPFKKLETFILGTFNFLICVSINACVQ